MQLLDGVTEVFEFKAANKLLRWETISAYLFSVIFLVDVLVLSYLVTGGVTCVRDDLTLETQRSLPRANQPSVWNYVNLTCGTELKWRSVYFYCVRIGYIIVAGMYVFFTKASVESLNQLEALAKKERVDEFAKEVFIEANKDYVAALNERVSAVFKMKIGLLVFYLAAFIFVTVNSYADADVRAIIFPFDNLCGGDGDAGKFLWNRERTIRTRCHFNQEFPIFFFLVGNDVLKLVLAVFFVIAMFHFSVYKERAVRFAAGRG